MRILFAGDEYPNSEYALKETIKLAMNTWADMTLAGFHSSPSAKGKSKGAAWPSDLDVGGGMRRSAICFSTVGQA